MVIIESIENFYPYLKLPHPSDVHIATPLGLTQYRYRSGADGVGSMSIQNQYEQAKVESYVRCFAGDPRGDATFLWWREQEHQA